MSTPQNTWLTADSYCLYKHGEGVNVVGALTQYWWVMSWVTVFNKSCCIMGTVTWFVDDDGFTVSQKEPTHILKESSSTWAAPGLDWQLSYQPKTQINQCKWQMQQPLSHSPFDAPPLLLATCVSHRGLTGESKLLCLCDDTAGGNSAESSIYEKVRQNRDGKWSFVTVCYYKALLIMHVKMSH